MASETRTTTAATVRLLGDWSSTGGRLSHSLERALRALIELGELRPGGQLPSERALADALAISRTTVTSAYQALADDGLVVREVGSGTRVARRGDAGLTINGPRGEDRVLRYMDSPLGTVDFVNAAVPGLPVVAEVAGSLTGRDYRHLMENQPYSPLGLWELRARIAEQLTGVGAPTVPEQILVTSGAQQALELVTSALIRPGDLILAEDPTFRAALQRLWACGARIEGMPADSEGVDVTAVEHAVARFPVRLAYLLPAMHNPTGSMLARERAGQLATLAAQTQTIVIDDRSLADTVFDGPPLPPLASLRDSDWILTLGSFSKAFWSGLRVGWIRASPRLIRGLAEVKTMSDLGTSLASQAIVLRLLDRVDEAVAERRRMLQAGYQRLTTLLGEWLPDWSWQVPRGGSSLWVRLPSPCAVTLTELAQRHGVAVLPGPIFSPAGRNEEHLRLPFAGRPAVLEAGVQRLAQAWSELTRYQAPEGYAELLG
jgi:DNA-binding transcriptional MocR family regulator